MGPLSLIGFEDRKSHGRTPRTTSRMTELSPWKRFLDIVGAGVLLILTAPVMGLTAVLVRCTLGSPILFRQVRPGYRGRPFTLYKFRTMTETRGSEGQRLPDHERLTAFGRLLRSTSLDELPELWNVFRGDMSLVGPRPLLMEYLPRYTARQARRHEVRPGITGWAQVKGRNRVPWEDRFELDVWYVENQSIWLDLWIILLTVLMVATREGVSESPGKTMAKFNGSEGDDHAESR